MSPNAQLAPETSPQEYEISNEELKHVIENLSNYNFDKSDVGLNPTEYIPTFGYPAEEYHPTTEDGYILTLHRIPYGVKSPLIPGVKRPVVLVQPGLLCSSAIYIDIGPQKSLGYLLADRGYDVWMGNFRGTTFSRNHTTLDASKDKKKYWSFSFHELGLYDNPTMIDFVLKQTEQEQLSYIGHSEGSTAFFVMTSEKPEYNEKVNIMVGLAPAAFMSHFSHPYIRPFAKKINVVDGFFKMFRIFEILPHNKFLSALYKKNCSPESSNLELCKFTVNILVGYNPEEFDLTQMGLIASHMPAGTSARQLIHFGQLVNTKEKFQKFDFGKSKNKKMYGSSTPPEYDLSKVTTPVFVAYGPNDTMAAPDDVIHLGKVLPNVIEVYRVNYDLFNHGDFLWANDVVPLIYDKVFEVLTQYNFEKIVTAL